MAEHPGRPAYEDPDVLQLNAMLHRMERDHCLYLARRARQRRWLFGSRAYHAHLEQARSEHFLAKLLQHVADFFLAASLPQDAPRRRPCLDPRPQNHDAGVASAADLELAAAHNRVGPPG